MSRIKIQRSCFIIIAVFLLLPIGARTEQMSPEMGAMLTTAESLFHDMQKKDYQGIWGKLSQRSRKTIIHDTYKSIRAQQVEIEEARVATDFARADEISQSYWNAFLNNFDPAIILEQCRWEIGRFDARRAQIKLSYKKSDAPAFLKMYKEQGAWKVGLTESFWGQKFRF